MQQPFDQGEVFGLRWRNDFCLHKLNKNKLVNDLF